jgi:hypothetical protein
MKLEDIKPAHCHALAQRLLAETRAIREEMGRSEDTRAIPEITGAEPREVYFAAIVAWRKAARLASELGVEAARRLPPTPSLRDLRPGHVLQVLEGAGAQLDDIKQRLSIGERAPDAPIETSRQPSDVLMTVVRINRELSRALERPFTPSDVFTTVSLASRYAERLGATANPAPFERSRQPAHCYERLDACLTKAAALVAKRGGKALAARGAPEDVQPGDVYDLANLVLGELAYLHALTPDAQPLYAFEPPTGGHRLPAHVHQLARTLEAQLAALG